MEVHEITGHNRDCSCDRCYAVWDCQQFVLACGNRCQKCGAYLVNNKCYCHPEEE